MNIDNAIPQLRDLPAGHLEARKGHLLAEIRRGHQSPRLSLWPLVPRRRIAALALAFGLLVIGTAIAATTTDWLTGSPAPKAVVSDFDSYAPQLGFDPEPGKAVLVAQEGDIQLYATTNTQGGYCLVTSAPWKRSSTLPDGGTCLPPAQTTAPLIAGVVGADSSPGSEAQTYLIAGRATGADARTIRFTGPTGDVITRQIGSSGFFITKISVDGSACSNGNWAPKFSALGADGKEVASATIKLGSSPRGSTGVCVFAAPHA